MIHQMHWWFWLIDISKVTISAKQKKRAKMVPPVSKITATTPLLDGFFSAAKLKPVNGETRTMEGPVREQPGVEGGVEIGNDSGPFPGVGSFDFKWYILLGDGFKYVLFLLLPGEMIQLDEHIFQMGWFNHQLV